MGWRGKDQHGKDWAGPMQVTRDEDGGRDLDSLRAQALNRICLLGSALVTLSLLWQVAIHPLQDTMPPAARRVLLLEALGLVAAAWLAARGRTRAAALLAATIATLPTAALSLAFGLPHQVILAAFIGALLVLAFAAQAPELIAATVVFTVLAVSDYLLKAPPQYASHGALATFIMVAGSGVLLLIVHRNAYRHFRSLQSSHYRFQRMSFIDPLTGLGNRRQFDLSLERAIELSQPSNPAALIIIDVDHLKQINDTHGHSVGDKALKAIAQAIRESTRTTDITTRIGGDEFAIILPQGGELGVKKIIERIRSRLGEISTGDGSEVDLSVSLGYALITDPNTDPTEALIAADRMLYADRQHTRQPVRHQG